MPANKNLHGGRWFVPLSSDHRIIYNIYYFSYIEIEVSISIYIFQTTYLVSTWIIIWILVDFLFFFSDHNKRFITADEEDAHLP